MEWMHPGSPACRFWTAVALCLAARAMGASEAIQYATPGPDYVIEKVTALPQVTFRAIQQTRDGYLWLGTYGGLIRFDGVRSIRFDVANT